MCSNDSASLLALHAGRVELRRAVVEELKVVQLGRDPGASY